MRKDINSSVSKKENGNKKKIDCNSKKKGKRNKKTFNTIFKFLHDNLLYELDIIALIIYWAFFGLGISETLAFLDFGVEYILIFITYALPLTVTVISIILTLLKRKIFGLTIKEFNIIRSKRTYRFDHVLYISIVILFLATISCTFDESVSLIALTFITLAFTIAVIYQEMIILLEEEVKIKNIVLEALKEEISDENRGIISFKRKLIEKGLLHVLLHYGYIQTLYDCDYDKNKNDVVDKTLITFNRVLTRRIYTTMEDFNTKNNNPCYSEFKESLSESIKILYLDFRKVFDKDGGKYRSFLFSDEELEFFVFFLIMLRKIEKTYDLKCVGTFTTFEFLVHDFNNIFLNDDRSGNENLFKMNIHNACRYFYVYAAIESLQHETLDFFKVEFNYLKSNYSKAQYVTPVLFLYSYLLWYLLYGKGNAEFKKEISNFLIYNKSFGCEGVMLGVRKFVDHSGILRALDSLLKIKDIVKDNEGLFSLISTISDKNDDKYFSDKHFILLFLEVNCLFSKYHYKYEEASEIENTFKECFKEIKRFDLNELLKIYEEFNKLKSDALGIDNSFNNDVIHQMLENLRNLYKRLILSE